MIRRDASEMVYSFFTHFLFALMRLSLTFYGWLDGITYPKHYTSLYGIFPTQKHNKTNTLSLLYFIVLFIFSLSFHFHQSVALRQVGLKAQKHENQEFKTLSIEGKFAKYSYKQNIHIDKIKLPLAKHEDLMGNAIQLQLSSSIMNVEENFLYTPVTFVYTRTIGEKVQEQQKDLYIWRYTDIVKVSRTYPYLYYLFHIAPIYNWMRPNLPACFELQQLTQYLKQSPPSTISPLSLQQIRDNILSYGDKWQVVKLCAKAQIRIDSSFKSCPHLVKTKQWSSLYNYDFQERKLYCQVFYCGKCEATHRADITILTSPFAPIFSAYYGDAITDTSQKDQKGNFVTYRLAIVYDNQSTFYIYAANQIWYQVKGNQITMKKYEFKKSKGGLFVYVKTTCFENLGLIRQAETLNKNKEELKNIRIVSPEIIDESEQNMQAKKQTENFQRKEIDQPTRKKSNKKLRSLHKKSQSIILPEEGYKSYKMEIEKLFHKPKQKDEYEKQYDKGKTKKIKKKGDYFKPDFNQVYKDLKKQTNEQKEIFPRKRTNMPHRRPNKLNKTNNSERFHKNQKRKWEKRVHK